MEDLSTRPSRRGTNVVALDSGAGLANATLQQRLVPVRLFYDYLIEEGLRESNPVGRGRYTPGRNFGGHQRGLIPRLTRLPWIPGEQQWLDLLDVVLDEPVRNRVMLALAYDAALRREELCSLRTDDLDPAHRTLRIRAETTKTRRERVVPYSAATGVPLSGYLAHRALISRSRGPLFLSESHRNYGQPLTLWLVQGDPASCSRGRSAAVLHPHHAASVFDRSGANGLGTARHRLVRRAPQHRSTAAPQHRVDSDLHAPLRPRPGGEVEPGHAADPLLARGHADPRQGGRRVTAQPSTTAARPTSTPAWEWPVDLARYDRHGLLTEAEAEALRNLHFECLLREGLAPEALSLRPVARLARPLADALAALHWPADDRHQRRFARDAAGLVLIRCGELRRAFWGWSVQDWTDLINASGAEFRRSWGGQIGPNARPFVLAYAYLLGEFTAFERLGRFVRPTLAHRIFGADRVDDAVQQVCKVLADWGYRRDASRLAPVICQMLLLKRSPLLEDLSTDALAALRGHPAMSGQWGKDLYGLHRAVAALGHADPPPSGHASGPAAMEGVPAPWAKSVERWYATSTLPPKIRSSYRSVLAKIGRWLAAEHPQITEPGQWTRQTCASWVAAVDRMAVGDFSQ